jgi:hypothetical protein
VKEVPQEEQGEGMGERSGGGGEGGLRRSYEFRSMPDHDPGKCLINNNLELNINGFQAPTLNQN